MSLLLRLATRPIEVTVVDDSGFDSLAACVGAAAAFGLTLIVAGMLIARSASRRSEGKP